MSPWNVGNHGKGWVFIEDEADGRKRSLPLFTEPRKGKGLFHPGYTWMFLYKFFFVSLCKFFVLLTLLCP